MEPEIIRAEFHCHTIRSKDSLLKPADLVKACKQKGIGRVVITDHNSIRGALEAQQIDPDLVIVGEEIMTSRGEILASFVKEEIPRGLDPQEVITRLREQGAFISVSHPMDRVRSGAWKKEDLDQIIDQVDAIEVFNARCWYSEDNPLALAYANQHHLPGTAGSDAHVAFELGRAVLEIRPFHTANELREYLPDAKMDGRLSSRWVHFTSFWAKMKKRGFQP